jgi:hypothetical protein
MLKFVRYEVLPIEYFREVVGVQRPKIHASCKLTPGMASEELITKRLHISGLTPALTASDISERLSSFGTVKAADGFGLLNGVGKQRKFGYITIETTPSKFAKCTSRMWAGVLLRKVKFPRF